MTMPVTIEIVDEHIKEKVIQQVLDYFEQVDNQFSTFKEHSEISRINKGELQPSQYSLEMRQVLALCAQTHKETDGYFDFECNGKLDPLGIVKGYAITKACDMLKKKGYKNFSVEIAGDIQVCGLNKHEKLWRIGIKNPFNISEIVKVIQLSNKGVATSGTYAKGEHIYNPVENIPAAEIAAITVIGPNCYEADRFATAAFAMGQRGIAFLERLNGFEGYMITTDKQAVMTSGFENYVKAD